MVEMMSAEIIVADVRDGMATLADQSVQCVVTSPPYWALRDYGVDGQIGLEPTPAEYVAALVAVFREVRRVLRDDGTVWLNLGDSYAGSGPSGASYQSETTKRRAEMASDGSFRISKTLSDRGLTYADKKPIPPPGLKPKDLIGIPWRVAFALQADGWVLRSDVIWSKPNPMPESVTDRPTKAHEYLFMFSKAKWTGPEPGPFAHICDEDARWLALFLDTEGNIVVKRVERNGRKWYGAQVAIAGSHRALLESARSIIGRGTILERSGTNAPMYYLQLSNQQAAGLLRRIYPYLIVKRRQARIAMHLQTLLRHRGGRGADRRRTDAEVAVLESLWQRNKACNQFGDPDLSDVPDPEYGKWTTARYYYDAAAIAEPSVTPAGATWAERAAAGAGSGSLWNGHNASHGNGLTHDVGNGVNRNKRTVWQIATQPFSGAHFATMPPELAERCIKAASRPGDTVLDPFGGAGTTGLVADRLQRNAILIELNPEYARLATGRVQDDAPLFAEVSP